MLITNIAHIQLLNIGTSVHIKTKYTKKGKIDKNAEKYLGAGARYVGISKSKKVLIKLGDYYYGGVYVGNSPPISVSPSTLEFYPYYQ